MINQSAHTANQTQVLYDNHGRAITYLRLAVTDRCNLRCFYCMPEEGINYLPKSKLLTYEEMVRIVGILATMGISKVRITGGEPFVRHNLIDFLYQLKAINGIQEINLTTNGVLTGQYIKALQDIGIRNINLSLGTLDPQRFFETTRRNEFDKVYQTLFDLLDAGFYVKLNAVVMEGKNTDDLIPLAELTKNYRRYLENVFRKVYKLEGTPVKIDFKTSENPFEGRKSKVDERTAARKRRYVQKFKKAEKKFKR